MRIQLKWQFKKTQTRHNSHQTEELPAAENAGPVPLLAAARCMALAKATEGGAAFHEYTYKTTTERILQWIVDDARAGRIHLVDEDGRPGTFDEILDRARNDGWACDAWSNPGATKTERNVSYGLVLFSTLDQLNQWAGPRGDEFYVDAPEQAAVPFGAPAVTPDDREQDEAATLEHGEVIDHNAALADLFDPVKVATLEAMFPDGSWPRYAERAASNGLKSARTGHGKFNPYRAAVWWIARGPAGWKWERCLRVLANNLPAGSRDSRHLLTGDFD